MSIRVVVAAHKPYRMPDDPMYLPLHVGACGKESIGFQRDDDGENISRKNPNYCELTGTYWAWKNLDADFVGLVHYRRHFSLRPGRDPFASVLTEAQAQVILEKTPLILPKKRRYYIETLASHYLHSHRKEGLDAFLAAVHELCPEYDAACQTVLSRRSAHMFNMYIMRRDLFCDFCAWMFPILEKTEEHLDLTGYSASEARVFGYVSEFMTDIYLEMHPVPYTEIPVIFTEKQNWFKKGGQFLKRKFFPSHIE